MAGATMNVKEWVASAALVFALGLAGTAGASAYRASVQLALLQEKYDRLVADHLRDDQQDKSIKMLWTYSGWLDTQTNELRFKAGLSPAIRPDFR